MPQNERNGVWFLVFFPAIAMLLGWGLRGYIGGGPFAAMIPGCFVALSLSLMLRHRMETAAYVALLGAIGIGYGGDMTYGQTLGLATTPETMAWGMLGVTVKGAVWGLLGGAVLGAGLTRRTYDVKTLTIAFAISIAAYYIGWKLINQPKLIYFSHPTDRPREESWAGLLFAAVAFLVYLGSRRKGPDTGVLMRFAALGAVGGALGFGGGTLWMVLGPSLPVTQKWFGWWKMMEFSFGFILGAFLGLCAYLTRDRIAERDEATDWSGGGWGPVVGVALVVVAAFWILPPVYGLIPDTPQELKSFSRHALDDLTNMLQTFIVFGGICIILGIRSIPAAWQVAITLTFFHTMVDFQRNFVKGSGFEVPAPALLLIVIAATVAMGCVVAYFQSRPRANRNLYLLILWSCYAVSCVKTFIRKEYLAPPPGSGGPIGIMLSEHPSMVLTHAIFTLSALAATCFILWGVLRTPEQAARAES